MGSVWRRRAASSRRRRPCCWQSEKYKAEYCYITPAGAVLHQQRAAEERMGALREEDTSNESFNLPR